MSEMQFIGCVKVIDTKYGDIIKLGMKVEDIEKLHKNVDDRGWVNVKITRSKAGKWYAAIDDYQPKERPPEPPPKPPEETGRYGAEDRPPPPPENREDEAENDDIPF
jgi:transposase